MKSKREKEWRRKIGRAAKKTEAAAANRAQFDRLNLYLKRAEDAGDMVKQNLIMEEIAKLEGGL